MRYVNASVLHREDNLERLGRTPFERTDLVYLYTFFFSDRHYKRD